MSQTDVTKATVQDFRVIDSLGKEVATFEDLNDAVRMSNHRYDIGTRTLIQVRTSVTTVTKTTATTEWESL